MVVGANGDWCQREKVIFTRFLAIAVTSEIMRRCYHLPFPAGLFSSCMFGSRPLGMSTVL